LRVLVCGDRRFDDDDWLHEVLNEYHDPWNQAYHITLVIQGGARGADKLAKEWAKAYGVPCHEYPADWNRFGKSAGVIRNKQMLDEGNPDLVIAFLAPDSRGTKNMIMQAKAFNVPVRIIDISEWYGFK
jgi:hypothetical protein